MRKIILRESISSRKAMVRLFTSASDNMASSGSGAGPSLINVKQTTQAIWMDMALARRSGQELRNSYIVTKSPECAPLRRFFKAAVDQLQILFDMSLVTSVQPKSFLTQMREAVADCDDGSSDGSLMLLSPPRDIPEAELPAGSSMEMEVNSPLL